MATGAAGFPKVKVKTFFEVQAWIVLFGISLMIGLFGIVDMVGGAADLQKGETVLMHSLTDMSWNELSAKNPQAANLIEWKFRTDGAALLTLAMFSGLVLLTGFRRGARWSWAALWALPVWLGLTVLFTINAVQYPGYGTPVPISSGSVLFVLWVASLVLTYRKFFH